MELAYDNAMLEKIIFFLNSINIKVIEKTLDGNCLLPGLDIKEDTILLDRQRLKYPGDLLHEAGHLAITPKELRPLIGTKEMDPAWPSAGDEIAAILWSYAAIRFLDIPPEVVFHENGYKNESEWIIVNFENGNYFGLPYLVWTGFCNSPEKPGQELAPSFPHMIKWLR